MTTTITARAFVALIAMILLAGCDGDAESISSSGADRGGASANDGANPSPPAATSYALGVTVSGSGTVTSNPAGIACPGDCGQSYAAGTSIALTATPAAGHSVRWTGCTASDNVCAVTMSAARSVTANFVASGGWPTLFVQSFESAGDYQSLLRQQPGNNPEYQHLAAGGFDGGGALRILPPNLWAEGYAGLDAPISPTQDTVYVRWLVRLGPTLQGALRDNNKHLILNRTDNDGGDARVIATLHPYAADAANLPLTNNIGPPSGTPFSFQHRADQWVSIEVGVSTSGNWRRMWVTTRDGVYYDSVVQDDSLSGHASDWSSVNLGYYWQRANEIARNGTNYLDVDELVISATKVGPPAGFVQ